MDRREYVGGQEHNEREDFLKDTSFSDLDLIRCWTPIPHQMALVLCQASNAG